MKAHYAIEWEKCLLEEFEHFPENFVYALYDNQSSNLLYIGSAYMESIKIEIKQKIGRLGLHLADVGIAIGLLENLDNAKLTNPKHIQDVEQYLTFKYTPTLNYPVKQQQLNEQLYIMDDDLF